MPPIQSPASPISKATYWPRVLLQLADFHREMLRVYLPLLGPRAAYAVSRWLARALYHLLPPLQARSEACCQAALGARFSVAEVQRIAKQAFVHRAWDVTDLLLADRLLHRGTFARFGGEIPQPRLSELLAAQARGQPAILLTAYYGPFDLLPVFLGFNGIRAAVAYQPHENAAFDACRRRIRVRSGCELVPVERALLRLPQVLEAGGSIALVADHPAGRNGLATTFFGQPRRVPKTVGLLAVRYDADVVVAGIRRSRWPFQFEIDVVDVLKSRAWADVADPLPFITDWYLRCIEQLISADPTQYLWAQSKWASEEM